MRLSDFNIGKHPHQDQLQKRTITLQYTEQVMQANRFPCPSLSAVHLGFTPIGYTGMHRSIAKLGFISPTNSPVDFEQMAGQ